MREEEISSVKGTDQTIIIIKEVALLKWKKICCTQKFDYLGTLKVSCSTISEQQNLVFYSRENFIY